MTNLKTQFGKIGMVSLAAIVGASMALAANPKIEIADYHTGYVPDGFDTNDHVQVVGEGLFNNSCYRPAGVKTSVNTENKTVNVQAKAYHYDGFCLQVLVPFHQVADLGIMSAGTYAVTQGTQQEKLADLKVRVATNSSPDDFLYAPVSQAYVTAANGKNQLTITGQFSNSCMKLVDVMVEAQPKVVISLPIAEMEEKEDCVKGSFPFEKTVELPSIEAGRYLLHVRSMNGTSVNTLFDVM